MQDISDIHYKNLINEASLRTTKLQRRLEVQDELRRIRKIRKNPTGYMSKEESMNQGNK